MEYADLVLDILTLAAALYCARRLRAREEPLPEVVDESEPIVWPEPPAIEVQPAAKLEPVAPYKIEPEPAEVAPYKVEPEPEIEPEPEPEPALPPEPVAWPEPPALEVPTGCAAKGHTWLRVGEEQTQGRMVRIYRCLHCPDKLREEAD